jgi:hypothetical protein
MAYFGGPTGTNQEAEGGRVVLSYYGNGDGIALAAPARSAVAMDFSDPEHVYAIGVSEPGDSGGPVASKDGRAVGVLVTGGVHGFETRKPLDCGTIGIVRLAPPLRRAEKRLALRLELRTAPLR